MSRAVLPKAAITVFTDTSNKSCYFICVQAWHAARQEDPRQDELDQHRRPQVPRESREPCSAALAIREVRPPE